ncbi:PAS domain-containing protein, partial [Rhodothermus marinus]
MKTPNASKLAAALEALPDGVILCDAEGRVRWANRRARKWLALPADEGAEARLPAVLPGLPWPPETTGHVR